MGQKVSPHGLRVGVIKDWDSKWYASKSNFADFLVEDNKVREYVKKKLYVAGVSKVVIERAAENKMRVTVLTAKPGMVIGRSGDGIEALKKDLVKMTGKEVEKLLDEAHITANKNTIPNEQRSPFVTSGIRLGSPAATTRGLVEEDMDKVAEAIALVIKKKEEGIAPARVIIASITEKYPLK